MDSVPTTSPLPRILCIHGGGASARIFNFQTVRIQRLLRNHFQFVFVDGPFLSDPGPGVSPFFDGMDPYWRWTRRKPNDHGEDVRQAVSRAFKGEGGGVLLGMGKKELNNGPLVGVLGFSQGSMLATGLLVEQHKHNEAGEVGYGLRFGVLMMSGQPAIDPSTGEIDQPDLADSKLIQGIQGGRITVPSLHVLGLQDPFLQNGRRLCQYYDPSTTIIQEYNVEHRLPTETSDNEKIAAAILELYKRTSGPSESRARANEG